MSIYCFGIRKSIYTRCYRFFKVCLNTRITENVSFSLLPSLPLSLLLSPLWDTLLNWEKSKDFYTNKTWYEEMFMDKTSAFQSSSSDYGRGQRKYPSFLLKPLLLFISSLFILLAGETSHHSEGSYITLIMFFPSWQGRVKLYSYVFE